MRTFSVIIVLLLVSLSLSARKQRTGPQQLHPVPAQSERVEPQPVPFDTVFSPSKSEIRFSGYDKPNRATRETFFVTNNLLDSVTIVEIEVTFTYSDMQDRMLHRASQVIKCDIPHGETRKLSVRSWDANNAFHYFRSTPPQRRASSPYKVSSAVKKAIVLPKTLGETPCP